MTEPILVYDADCDICTRAAVFISSHADVELVGFSELDEETRASLPPDFERCAHLVVDGRVYSCGEAMERAFELTTLPAASLPSLLRRVPGYEPVREGVYRWVADNRPLVSRLLS